VCKSGITLTDLRACGSASVDGEIIDVRALQGFIPRQTRIVVRMLDGATPVVETQQ